jgi:hypothetical protein
VHGGGDLAVELGDTGLQSAAVAFARQPLFALLAFVLPAQFLDGLRAGQLLLQ